MSCFEKFGFNNNIDNSRLKIVAIEMQYSISRRNRNKLKCKFMNRRRMRHRSKMGMQSEIVASTRFTKTLTAKTGLSLPKAFSKNTFKSKYAFS